MEADIPASSSLKPSQLRNRHGDDVLLLPIAQDPNVIPVRAHVVEPAEGLEAGLVVLEDVEVWLWRPVDVTYWGAAGNHWRRGPGRGGRRHGGRGLPGQHIGRLGQRAQPLEVAVRPFVERVEREDLH